MIPKNDDDDDFWKPESVRVNAAPPTQTFFGDEVSSGFFVRASSLESLKSASMAIFELTVCAITFGAQLLRLNSFDPTMPLKRNIQFWIATTQRILKLAYFCVASTAQKCQASFIFLNLVSHKQVSISTFGPHTF